MTQKPSMTGSRLLDLCARRLADGYLEVVAQTDGGMFGLGRNQVNALARAAALPAGFDSQLAESYRNAVIQEVWIKADFGRDPDARVIS